MLQNFDLNKILNNIEPVQILLFIGQLFFFFGVVISISFILFIFIFRSFYPTPIIKESIYFKFNQIAPTASIYLTNCHPLSSSQLEGVCDDLSKYNFRLKPGYIYDIDATFQLSKSERNFELGKVSLSTSIYDTMGNQLIETVRPLVIPYQSFIYRNLESVALFPLRLVHIIPSSEYTEVNMNLIESFKESALLENPKSYEIQLKLNDPRIDIVSGEITITPQYNIIS